MPEVSKGSQSTTESPGSTALLKHLSRDVSFPWSLTSEVTASCLPFPGHLSASPRYFRLSSLLFTQVGTEKKGGEGGVFIVSTLSIGRNWGQPGVSSYRRASQEISEKYSIFSDELGREGGFFSNQH